MINHINIKDITQIGALLLLGISLWQARRLSSDVVSNIDKFQTDMVKALAVVRNSMTSFYLAFATVAIIVASIFDKIDEQLFVGLLVAVLTGLGVKVAINDRSDPGK